MKLTFKSILSILLFSIPLNYIVIEGIGNIYLSTLIILILFSWLFVASAGKMIIKNNAVMALIVFFITAITTVINVVVYDSSLLNFQLTNTVIYFQVMLVFIIVNYMSKRITLEHFFKIFLIITFIAIIRVLIEEPEHFFELSVHWYKRIRSYFIGGVNNFALITSCAFIISFFHIKNIKLKVVACLFYFIVIILSMSRGALFASILALFLTSLYDTNRATFKVLIKSTFFVICFGIIFLAVTGNLEMVVDKVSQRFFGLFTGEQNVSDFFSGRGHLIVNILEKLSDSSVFQILFGHGNGGVDFYDPVSNQDYETSHNILIDVLYRNGVFLLLFYMIVFTQLLWMFLKNRTKEKLTLFGLFVFIHIELLVNPILFAAQVGWLYAIFMVFFLKQNQFTYLIKNDTVNYE